MPGAAVTDQELAAVLERTADAVAGVLAGLGDRRRRGERPGQYALDLVADAAALEVLHGAGLRVLSEESGVTGPAGGNGVSGPPGGHGGSGEDGLLAVLDPVDGSTNAASGLPWYATSICVLDDQGPRLALVANLATGVRYRARRGGGATRDGVPIAPSGAVDLGSSVVGISGAPGRHLGWWQFRALGAAALDLCAVADGSLDGYRVVGGSTLFPWDYLGGLLVCTEAGAAVGELDRAELVVRDGARRRPVAAATPALLRDLAAAP